MIIKIKKMQIQQMQKQKKQIMENRQLIQMVKMQMHYLSRVSHPEPGMTPKAYYKDLREKFGKQVTEILDQINS